MNGKGKKPSDGGKNELEAKRSSKSNFEQV